MKLTEFERKVLCVLDFHAREPVSMLAKKLQTSKQRLTYTIKKLEEKGIIQGYYADINPSKLGLVIYLVYFKFFRLSKEKEERLINHFNKSKRVSVNVSTQGKWDHSIAIFAKDLYEYRGIYDSLMKSYEEHVKEKVLTIITDYWYYPPHFLLSKEYKEYEPVSISMHGPLQETKIDDTDRLILKELATNTRISLLKLSEKTHLTANGIRARIKQLEKRGVIMGYRVMIDYVKLGMLHYRIFFFLENMPIKYEKFRSFLSFQPEVISITKAEGYCQLDIRIIVKDISHFYEFVGRINEKFPDLIRDYEPLIYFKFYKSLSYYPVD